MPSTDSSAQVTTPTSLPATVRSAERQPARRALRTTIAVAGPGAIVSSTAIGRNVQTTGAAYPAPMDLTLLPFDRPTETRTFEKGRFEVYEVGPMTLGRATYEPGWRWSEHVGEGALCQVEHVGLVLSGAAAVKMDDGTERVMQRRRVLLRAARPRQLGRGRRAVRVAAHHGRRELRRQLMRLHDYPASGNCYKVRLLLAQLGRDYERVNVDIFDGGTLTDEFGALNPTRTTPVLELDDGEPLIESNAILTYLAEGTDLVPDDRSSGRT